MSLKPIRNYFRQRFLDPEMNGDQNTKNYFGSDYVEHADAFNTENIASTNMDRAYHIFYGSVSSSSLNHLTTKDTVNATVSVFSKGYSDPTEALDEAMDFANKFRLHCMHPRLATTGQFIKNVVCESFTASPVNDQNDNSIIVRLQFRITVIFGIGINLDCDC